MAFAGYAIYYQGKELQEQKKELSASRFEFEITRATNILYKQIEQVDKAHEKIVRENIAFFQDEKITLPGLGFPIIAKLRWETAQEARKPYDTMILENLHDWLLKASPAIKSIIATISFFHDFRKSIETNKVQNNKEQLKILANIITYNIPVEYFNIASKIDNENHKIIPKNQTFYSVFKPIVENKFHVNAESAHSGFLHIAKFSKEFGRLNFE